MKINNYPSFQNKNKNQNVNGVSERIDIRKLKLGTRLGEQINNTSLTFEKKEHIVLPNQDLQCMNSEKTGKSCKIYFMKFVTSCQKYIDQICPVLHFIFL